MACRGKRCLTVGEHEAFALRELMLYLRVVVETCAQLFVDGLVHPVAALFGSTALEIAVFVDKSEVTVDHVPDLRNAQFEISRICQHFWIPARCGLGEEPERRAELCLCKACALQIVAVGLVDDYAVGHFHDAAFDALQLVAGARELYEQEEVDHRVYGSLALPHADCLDENIVVACGFAEYDRFARFPCDSSERTGRRTRANECRRMQRQPLHACLVAENAPFCALA